MGLWLCRVGCLERRAFYAAKLPAATVPTRQYSATATAKSMTSDKLISLLDISQLALDCLWLSVLRPIKKDPDRIGEHQVSFTECRDAKIGEGTSKSV